MIMKIQKRIEIVQYLPTPNQQQLLKLFKIKINCSLEKISFKVFKSTETNHDPITEKMLSNTRNSVQKSNKLSPSIFIRGFFTLLCMYQMNQAHWHRYFLLQINSSPVNNTNHKSLITLNANTLYFKRRKLRISHFLTKRG